MKFLLPLLALVLAAAAPFPAKAEPSPQESAAIEHLILFVRDSGLVFVRNGAAHDAAEAGDHIAMKYAQAREDISTAEEFIDNVASKSQMTGMPYLIRFPDGSEQPVSEWLHAELKKYRKSLKAPRL